MTTTSTDYAPFPLLELEAFAAKCESVSRDFLRPGLLRQKLVVRARVCREAIAAQEALRDRCLLAELNLGQALSLLAHHGIAFTPLSEAAD